jgi:hypothetical protein
VRVLFLLESVLVLLFVGCSRTSPPPKRTVREQRDANREGGAGGIILTEPFIKGKRAADWIKTLEEGDVIERRKAVEALYDFAQYAGDPHQPMSSQAGNAAVAALAKALKDRDQEVRLKSAHFLGEVGRKARAALPSLREALKDPDAAVAESAALPLRKVDPAAAEAHRK